MNRYMALKALRAWESSTFPDDMITALRMAFQIEVEEELKTEIGKLFNHHI